jgi:NAD(P)-dependent dehydrogenase (short-subunit alcohol dehydrogenase family)
LRGQQAIVTGGGSGIGAALVRALTALGADVLCTDVDVDAAKQSATAAPGPGTATAEHLDVTDAAAVQAAVDGVVARAGRLDFMFNNAGIVWGGDTELLTLEQWNAIIDVNIRGVVHGVLAAYPLMIRQGHGHIINTASLAGLVPGGRLVSYSMTKHAVVGLSLGLRAEALRHGVNVLVVCPGAVETPILDKGGVGDFEGRSFFLTGQGSAYNADELASDVLRAVERKRAMLVEPRVARLGWRFARLSPSLLQRSMARMIVKGKQRR